MKETEDKLNRKIRSDISNMEIMPPASAKTSVMDALARMATRKLLIKTGIIIIVMLITGISGAFLYKYFSNKAQHTIVELKNMQSTTSEPNINNKATTLQKSNTNTTENQIQENNADKKGGTVTADQNSIINIVNPSKNKNTISNAENNLRSESGNLNNKSNATTKNFAGKKQTNKNIKLFTTKSQTVNKSVKSDNEINISFQEPITENGIESVSIEKPAESVRSYFDIQKIEVINNSDFNSDQIARLPELHFPSHFMWSYNFYLGHNVFQKPLLSFTGNNNDAVYKYASSMAFPSFTAGINFRAEKRHLFFDLGIQLSMFSEKLNADNALVNPHTIQVLNYTGQSSVIDTNGGYMHYTFISDSVIHIIDSVWTWRVDTSYFNTYDTNFSKIYDTLKNSSWKNTYTFIELPLAIGYEFNLGRFNLGLSTGPVLNMLACSKGYLPAYMNEETYFRNTQNELKKYSFGLSWNISLYAGILLNERWRFEIIPDYRFSIINIKSVSYGLKSNSLGINCGLRYYF